MPLVTADDVQLWLEPTKILIDSSDELAEESFHSAYVTGRLASKVVVTGWVSPSTTPVMVRSIIGMRVAAQRYNVAYSETSEDDGNPYANKLMEWSEMLIQGILDGTLLVVGIPDTPGLVGTIAFYPTDLVGLEFPEEAARFAMGHIF